MKRDYTFRAKRAVLVFFSAWLILSLAAPFTLPPGSVTDLSGRVGKIDNGPAIGKMNPFAATIYLVGDFNCHQLQDRSYFLNGNQMPYCARDTGIFIGLVVGMLIVLAFSPKFYWTAAILMGLPILLDGGLQMVTSYESTNLLRLATGLLGGITASYFLGHLTDVSAANQKKRLDTKAE